MVQGIVGLGRQLGGILTDLLQLGGKTLVVLIVLLAAIPLILLLIGAVGPLAAVALVVIWPLAGTYCTFTLRRYLRAKLAPVFAAAAVTLCTAMVIIVISVMGGFLTMLEGATKTLEGDLTISGGTNGFPYYEQLMDELRKLPEVAAASPTITTFGLVKIGDDLYKLQIDGVDPASLNKVIDYQKTLYWDTPHLNELLNEPPRALMNWLPPLTQPGDDREKLAGRLLPREAGMNLEAVVRPEWSKFWQPENFTNPDKAMPGIVLGVEVSRYNRRDHQGQYHLRDNRTLGQGAVLTLMPISLQSAPTSPTGTSRAVVVVNEFKSGALRVRQVARLRPAAPGAENAADGGEGGV